MALVFVYITCANVDEARKIGSMAVAEHLASCANIIPGMSSIYRWEGKIETADETVLILKSRAVLFDRLAGEVRKLHSYSTPCIMALPVTHCDPKFMDWIETCTRVEKS